MRPCLDVVYGEVGAVLRRRSQETLAAPTPLDLGDLEELLLRHYGLVKAAGVPDHDLVIVEGSHPLVELGIHAYAIDGP